MENINEIRENHYFSNPQSALPNSTAVLVLGIISIVGCFCYGIVGFICSIIAMVESPQAYTLASYNNLKTGRVCALVGLILSALYLLAIIVVIIIFGAAFLANPQEILNQMQ